MEYITNSETEGAEGLRVRIEFGRYQAYVKLIKKKLPAHVYSLASDSRYFDLQSRSSFHDAWLENLTIRECATGKRNETRKLEIHLCLLGPFHDRRIHLHYTGVARYSFDITPQYQEPRYKPVAYGDLLTHEIRLGHDGLLIHELLFERDSTFLIECSDIRHSEEIISNDVKPADGKHSL